MSAATLNNVLRSIDDTVAEGGLPVLVFDLDGTLLDNRPRTLRILREFVAAHIGRWPALDVIVGELTADDLGYDARDAVRERGFDDPEAFGAFFAFWKDRFFTDAYLVEDVPTPGAVEYARACWNRGAHLYYLTGRHVGGMEAGTAESLARLGFPMYAGRSSLHLKPGFDVPDPEFKDGAIAQVRSMKGPVLATFENEPGHANLFEGAFPGAATFLVDTGHSTSAPPPSPTLLVVDDFLS